MTEKELLEKTVANTKTQLAALQDDGSTKYFNKFEKLTNDMRRAERKLSRLQDMEIDLTDMEGQVIVDLKNTFIDEHNMYFIQGLNKMISVTPSDDEETNLVLPWHVVTNESLKWFDTGGAWDKIKDNMLVNLFRSEDRMKKRLTYSFNPQPANVLNLMKWNPLKAKSGQVHWFFNILVQSLGGSKKENCDHLEQWVVHKLHHPENFMMPALVFNDNGSTGKTLFVERLLATAAGKHLVVNTDMASVAGQFNAMAEGKAFVCLNEVSTTNQDSNALKRILGSPRIKIERKGIDSSMIDNTAAFILTGNNIGVGTIKLGNNKSDRRYSIINGGAGLDSMVAKHLKCTVAEAAGWIQREGQFILSDPEQVSYWLNDIESRHGVPDVLLELHGEDYQNTVSAQASVAIQIFETIFRDPSFTYVKRNVLFDFFKHKAPSSHMNNRTFYSLAEEWLKNNMPNEVTFYPAVYWGGSSADIWKLNTYTGKTLPNDDRYYIETADNYGNLTGRRVWIAEIQ
jgi:hypothetical protein